MYKVNNKGLELVNKIEKNVKDYDESILNKLKKEVIKRIKYNKF